MKRNKSDFELNMGIKAMLLFFVVAFIALTRIEECGGFKIIDNQDGKWIIFSSNFFFYAKKYFAKTMF